MTSPLDIILGLQRVNDAAEHCDHRRWCNLDDCIPIRLAIALSNFDPISHKSGVSPKRISHLIDQKVSANERGDIFLDVSSSSFSSRHGISHLFIVPHGCPAVAPRW